jgi:glycosyltransferase involved in cell wall biosynthesis
LRANGSNAYFGSILNTPVKWQTRLYEKNLYRKAFRYIAVSKFTADKTSDVLGLSKPFTIIYNGHSIVENMLVNEVPSKVKNYLPNDYIVFSGTLIRKKGIYELVMAVVSLLESGSNLTLVINGKDTKNPGTGVSVRYELEQLIPERFRKFFIFNGHVPREVLIEQYRSARAAVFPSYAEAFAMVPLESMEQGCPTIFSNQTSGNEIIDDGIDGLLINPFDPVNIANAIRRILIEPELGLKLGQKGKEKVLMFSAERMFKESLVFYQECIEQYALKYGKSK